MSDWLRQLNKRLFTLYAIIAFFILWEVAAQQQWIDTQFIPAFSTVMAKGWELLISGQLLIHIATSLQRIFLGFLLAVGIALPLGFALGGCLPAVTKFLMPLFNTFAQINAFTLFPLFIILFGIGEGCKISIIFWAAIWPILFTTIAGVQQIDPLLIKAASAMGAKGPRIFFQVVLPGAATRLATGIKSGMTMAFMILIGAELMGSEAGLGWLIQNSKKNYEMPRMYVAIITIAIVGLLISYLLDWLEDSIITWKEVSNDVTL
ncbi:ABC transporter permease [Clostridium aminobutyricum]|uniref:ABC transporter permease n=2 Tax=Clostridium aminobutyricum TaxID=33953 RepID=A0A939D934_CLOAM|nr:ABC transporter permease [Clostridium aminobutyricum]